MEVRLSNRLKLYVIAGMGLGVIVGHLQSYGAIDGAAHEIAISL